jgi:uncharacterized protein YxjI
MQALESVGSLIVSQKKEWGEILSGLETRNKYVVLDEAGRELYYAIEEGGSFLLRSILKALRPFEILITNTHNDVTLRVKRPFRFYFHEVTIHDGHGTLLGRIRRRFAFPQRLYTVYDDQKRQLYELHGPLMHPWTFIIRKDEQEFGKITKRWSGLAKEAFTDSDLFGVTLPPDWPAEQKALMLGAVFLIDFVHFENTNKN